MAIRYQIVKKPHKEILVIAAAFLIAAGPELEIVQMPEQTAQVPVTGPTREQTAGAPAIVPQWAEVAAVIASAIAALPVQAEEAVVSAAVVPTVLAAAAHARAAAGECPA